MPDPAETTDSTATLSLLSRRLQSRFLEWERTRLPWTPEEFNELGLSVFSYQYRFNTAYRNYCDRRLVTPNRVGDWREIPPVPTAVFRQVDLTAGVAGADAVTFVTSGTTRGMAGRGRHVVLDPNLYRSSLRASFRVFALGHSPVSMCALHERFTSSGDSSLGWMLEDLVSAFGDSRSINATGPTGIDHSRALQFCETAIGEARPVYLLGTTLALDEWLRWMERNSIAIQLTAGSRVMDTGGAKGREGLSRISVVERLVEYLGVDEVDVINEFGMTELLSQRYSVPSEDHGGTLLVGPPWLRTRVLDPVSLEELPDGDAGVLCHFDLANLGSVSMVLTEDLGVGRGDRIEWIGRSPGAPPRGCSLATAELLEAQNVR